jgi:NAD(P)H-hydrate repair Nnr-like enzyme with NAD(P)H-hydrate epimerase domain
MNNLSKSDQTFLISLTVIYSLVLDTIKVRKANNDLTEESEKQLNNIIKGIQWYYLPAQLDTLDKPIDAVLGSLSNVGTLPPIETMIKLINGEETTADDYSSNATITIED